MKEPVKVSYPHHSIIANGGNTSCVNPLGGTKQKKNLHSLMNSIPHVALLLEWLYFLESAVFGPVEDDLAIPLTDPDARLTKIYSSQP